MHIHPIAAALAFIVPGQEVSFQNLVMLPLLARRPDTLSPEPDYDLLDDGLASGLVEITEVSEGGSVPELRVVNRGPKPTLIVDGQELLGAKQNRVVNLTILARANGNVTIPVSCVEAGRWRARSRVFSSAPRAQYASGRGKRMSQVSASMKAGERGFSDQSQVWADISAKAARLHSPSPTGAMEAIYLQHDEFIDSCVEACRPVPGQLGALFIVAGRIACVDLFDSETTLRRLLPKLVRSAAVDALDAAVTGAEPPAKPFPFRALAEHFLAAVGESPRHSSAAIGMGEDVRLSAPGLTGAALVVDGRAVHLAAFPLT